LFVSNRDDNKEIYLLNTSGSLANLTNHPASDSDPNWFPDGKRIVFLSNRDGNPEIYLMNLDGSELINLTNDPAADSSPVLSPDGTRIAFLSERGDESDDQFYTPDIYILNVDGSGLIKVTNRPADYRDLVWSPDSQWLVFFARHQGEDMHNSELYRMDADGSHLIQLTIDPCQDVAPAWSPDGKQIVFTCATEGTAEIHVINADGSSRIALTQHSEDQPASDFSPAWSPDGRSIAFSSDRDGDYAIFIMNADGSNVNRLIAGTTDDSSPRWSPAGTQILFARGDYRQQEIYLIDINDILQESLEPTNLTNHPADNSMFVWQPQPK
jgi:TolB protein